MSEVCFNKILTPRRALNRAARRSILAACCALGIARQGLAADTTYFYQGTGTGTWDTTSGVWATPTSGNLPLTQWVNSATSDATFAVNESGITIGTNITANILTFTQSSSVTFQGSNTLTLNSIFNQVGSQAINFTNPIASPGQLVIHGVTYPNTNGKGVSLLADTNQLNGGVLLTGGSVYFTFGNSANHYEVDPSHPGTVPAPINSPGGIVPGSTAQNGPIMLTSIEGPGNSFPAITVDGNGSTVGLASIKVNDYVLPNPVVLNPSNASNFYTAIGAGSVADSGTVASGPFPAYATINFAGQISGNGSVIISNDFYGGGGKGFTIFSNPNNNYTGQTIVNNNGQNYLTFQVGAQGAIPASSDLVFGAKSVGQAIGDTSISGKQIGAIDLNGFDTTVKSLSSDVASNLYVLGITNTNNHATDPSLTSGPHATDASQTSTLTIDSQGSVNNTFFQGNITDGSDFLTQANATTGVYKGPYAGAASNYLLPANGLKVALKLAPTNAGVLTLNATNGSTGVTPNAVDLGYSGGTTVGGGSLYVNGAMTAPSGSTVSQVLVTSPIAGHVAVFGGTGTINPDVHVQSGATLAPGSAPAPLATGSGTSFSALPTAFNIGSLTVKNLTMNGGSQFNFVINDGSATAVAGTGFGNLAFSAGGSFTEDASVTAGNPIFVHPLGTFTSFANYKNATWNLATMPVGSVLSNIVLDTRAGYSPLPAALLAGGTFSVGTVGTNLNLIFTPSPTVTALQYSGPAAGTWNSVPANTIWTDLVHGAGSTFYADPGNVLFATPTANTTVTIQGAGVSPASVIFTNAAQSGSVTVSYTLAGGSINGAAPLSLNGSGHIILAGTNAYTGGTGISGGGTIETQVSGALGTGDVSIYNGTWNSTSADQTYPLNVQVLGSAAATPATVSAIQTGPLTGPASGNLTITGNISGSGALTKTGVGTLQLNGNLSQNGGLNVNAGKLIINGIVSYTGTTTVAANAGVEYQTATNATIGFQSSAVLNGNLTFDNLSNVTFSPGTYSGTGQLIVKTSGTLIQGVGGVIGGSPVDLSNGITLNPGNAPSFQIYFGMAGNGNKIWLRGPISGNGDVFFGAGPGQGGGANIDLYGNSTYTGGTHLDTGGMAIVTLQTNNALPTTTTLTFGSNGQGAGFMDLNGHAQTLAMIQTDPLGGGFGGLEDTAGGGVLTVNGSTSGEFKALIAGIFTLNVAMQNHAVLDLSYQGSNNGGTSFGNVYGGQTNVTSGVLRFSNSLAFSPNQNLSLNGGVLEIHANGFGNFMQNLGSGANQVQIAGGTSGFSAFGSVPAVFNLGGSGATVVWGSSFFQPTTLVLNEVTATNTLDFQNNIDLNGAARTVTVNSTLAGTDATISGSISGTGGFTKTGPGNLILTGVNTYNGTTTVTGGKMTIAHNTSLPQNSAVNLSGGGKLVISSGLSAVKLSSLTISGTATAPTATLDLTNGGLVLPYASGGAGLTATTYKQVIAARGNADSNGLFDYSGMGITSSTAAASDVAAGFDKFGSGRHQQCGPGGDRREPPLHHVRRRHRRFNKRRSGALHVHGRHQPRRQDQHRRLQLYR